MIITILLISLGSFAFNGAAIATIAHRLGRGHAHRHARDNRPAAAPAAGQMTEWDQRSAMRGAARDGDEDVELFELVALD